MQKHIGERLSLSVIAKEVGYSIPWIERIFIDSTGRGVKSHLIRIRIERAKELLRTTDLGVSEIAYEVGYASHERFTAAFSKFAGTSPSRHRKTALQESGVADGQKAGADGARLWFTDQFKGNAAGNWWGFPTGSWNQKNGLLEGFGDENACMQLMRPLPENFRITFDCFLSPLVGADIGNLVFFLRDEKCERDYCRIEMGLSEGFLGDIRRFGLLMQTIPRPLLKTGCWQKTEVVLRDDTLSIQIDSGETLSFRDPFPPPYGLRCRFVLNAWRSMLQIRNFSVEDLGYYALARAIRQGDALFTAGIFAQAREFFVRLQHSGLSHGDAEELSYKIGMCFLGEGDYAGAAEWLQKAADFPAGNFWSQHATLSLLDLLRKQEKFGLFREKAGFLFSDVALKERVWAMVENTCRNLSTRGFYDQSLSLYQEILKQESKGSRIYLQLLQSIGDTLISQNRFESSSSYFAEMVWLCKPSMESSLVQGLFGQADCFFHLGRIADARGMVAEIRAKSRDFVILARCEIYDGYFLRSEKRFDSALEKFAGVHGLYPNAMNFRVFALLLSSMICCSLGKIVEAEAAQKQACDLDPSNQFVNNGVRSRFLYPLCLVKGEYARGAQAILSEVVAGFMTPAIAAENTIKAGILLQLSGESAEAKRVWQDMIKRMPPAQCHYFAQVAQGLLNGDTSSLTELPYPIRVRSELFYLTGLLLKKWSQPDLARKFFMQSALEDTGGDWPGVLAEAEISGEPAGF